MQLAYILLPAAFPQSSSVSIVVYFNTIIRRTTHNLKGIVMIILPCNEDVIWEYFDWLEAMKNCALIAEFPELFGIASNR